MKRQLKAMEFVAMAIIGCSMLTACGGGGGDLPGIGASSGGVSNTGTARMSITRYNVSPSTVRYNQKVTVEWSVDYATPTTGYTMEFHLNNDPSLVSGLSGLTRVFNANGGMGTLTLGKDATITCTFSQSSGQPMLSCGTYGSRYLYNFDLTKPLYGIFKACTYDASMQQVCDTKVTGPLTFSTTTAKEPSYEEPIVPSTSGEPAGAESSTSGQI